MANGASSCPHITSVWNSGGHEQELIAKFKSVVTWNVNRLQATRPAKRRKIAAPACGTCDLALSRPFACLTCSYTGCWAENHVTRHLKDAGHTFCVDAQTGSVFCSGCDNFIYDAKLEGIYLAAVIRAQEKQTKFQVEKKPRETFTQWIPNSKDNAALDGADAIPCQGRRGLLNLGQTCFLNVVLQCLIHNPLLRNYYLSDKHNCKQCKLENCTSCEMDKLFTEIYSDDPLPHGPITFLATTWKASAELCGYAQQDAHEFFISTLNQIHLTSRGFTNVSCNCIIHSTFAGQLRSDVKCERCGNVTTTVDPMLDISLELKGKGSEIASGENTLGACLRRFTQPEKLGPKDYTCGRCGKNPHDASKRFSIRTLPPVLSFQFKRFEHKTSDKSSACKIDASIRFPASLNMAPYTTLTMGETEKDNGGSSFLPKGPEAMYEYDLFAVINHEGQINNGHYTNYARFQDEWYRFDDDKVTHSSLGACLNSPAYMCFYVKRHLDYMAHTTPSYVRARENEAAREKELEKGKELEKKLEKKKEKELEKEKLARMKEVEDDLLAIA